MLVAAHEHGCLREMLAIASFLGIQDPRERPADQRGAADAAHAQFADPRSEFVGILKLWDAYRAAHEDLTQSQLRKWAEKHFLGFLRLREWRELHRQLKLVCDELGWPQDDDSANRRPRAYAHLHRALIAGLPTQVGNRAQASDRKTAGLYDGPRGTQIPAVPGLRAGEEAATLGAVGDAAGHRTRVGADQRRDRARLGDRRTAAPAGAPPPRSALVALAGARGRQRADQPVRAGAGAQAARPLRRAVPGGSAADLRARCAGDRRDQYPQRVPRAQPRDAGEGAGRGSQAAPCRPGRRRGLAGALVPRPPAAATCTTRRRSMRGTRSCRRRRRPRWNGRGRPAGRRRNRCGAFPAVSARWATRGWRCAIASSRARSTTA